MAGDLHIVIRSLRAQNSGAEVAVGVLLRNGEQEEQKNFILTMEQYCDLMPQKGEIDEEYYDHLEEASNLCLAMRCGENLLSYGSNPVQTLARKIMQHGFERETALRAAQMLEEKGLIDEDSDLRREVEKCVAKLWGAKRISAHVWSRGFSGERLRDLPELLGEIDFSANCAKLIRKHYGGVPSDEEEKRRMTAGLTRYGYSLPEIRAAMKILASGS